MGIFVSCFHIAKLREAAFRAFLKNAALKITKMSDKWEWRNGCEWIKNAQSPQKATTCGLQDKSSLKRQFSGKAIIVAFDSFWCIIKIYKCSSYRQIETLIVIIRLFKTILLQVPIRDHIWKNTELIQCYTLQQLLYFSTFYK